MFNISGQNVNFVPGGPKNWHTFLYTLSAYALTSSNIDRFSNLFHFLNQKNIVLIIPSLRSHHTSNVSLHYFLDCQCFKSNNWKKDDFYNI